MNNIITCSISKNGETDKFENFSISKVIGQYQAINAELQKLENEMSRIRKQIKRKELEITDLCEEFELFRTKFNSVTVDDLLDERATLLNQESSRDHLTTGSNKNFESDLQINEAMLKLKSICLVLSPIHRY